MGGVWLRESLLAFSKGKKSTLRAMDTDCNLAKVLRGKRREKGREETAQ